MGLLKRMMKGFGGNRTRLSRSQQSQVPTFEQLEPRILLSADASLAPDFQPPEIFEEQVISVDLEPGLGEEGRGQKAEEGSEGKKVGSEEESNCETVGRSDSGTESGLEEQKVGIEEEKNGGTVGQFDGLTGDGLEGEKAGSEEEGNCGTVGQSDGLTVGRSDSPTVEQSNSLSVSQLATAANLSDVQNTEAHLLTETAQSTSDSPVILSDGQTVTPLDATLESIETRGPPANGPNAPSFSEATTYTAKDESSNSPSLDGAPRSFTPEIPGLTAISAPSSAFQGQIVYLDLDGAQGVTYDGPVTVAGIDVPIFEAPVELFGQEQSLISQALEELEQTFAGSGVIFTLEQPSASQSSSTIYIGGDDSAFSEFGSFLGLAEQVDIGNRDQNDSAFVFVENIPVENSHKNAWVKDIVSVLAHELGHLLGYGHDDSHTEGGGILSEVAEESPTEVFSGFADPFDLANTALMFTPDGTGSMYHMSVQAIEALPTPVSGQGLGLGDDSATLVQLAGAQTVSLYDRTYDSFYVGSNGYITFDEPDTGFADPVNRHLDAPRISVLLDDLQSRSPDTVLWKQLSDRAVVTWDNTRQFQADDSNTFQVEMYYDGRIQMAWLDIACRDGLVGLSDGQGMDPGFAETDLSEVEPAPTQAGLPLLSINNVNIQEGDQNGNSADFTVRLSGPSTQPVTVAYTTVAHTASAHIDFAYSAGLLTMPAGHTEASISVTVIGDTDPEFNETFHVLLSDPTGAVLGDHQGSATLLNDDLDTDLTVPFELFRGFSDSFDLSHKAIMFTPDSAGSLYYLSVQDIQTLPSSGSGQGLGLGDDNAALVQLANDQTVSIYGHAYDSFYVGSNGYITFAEPDTGFVDPVNRHFNTQRISVLLDDLQSRSADTVRWQQLPDRVVVTWNNTHQFQVDDSNTFQVEMYYDGRIQMAWLDIACQDGLVGLSHGQGPDPGFGETDFSDVPEDLTAPVLTDWDLIQDTGTDPFDRLTNDTTPELVFTFSEPVYGNAGHIDLRDPAGAVITPDTISGWGTDTLRVTITTALILDGEYTITLDGTDCIIDALGNPLNNGQHDEIVKFFLDTTAPVVTVNSLATKDATPELTGTVDDAQARVVLSVDGHDYAATNNGNGTWTLAQGQIAPVLTDGIYDIAVTAEDQAGNVGTDSSTNELKIDLTYPKLISWDLIQDTGTDPTDRQTNDTTPELVFTFSEPVYGGAGHIDLRDPAGAAVIPDSISGWGTDTLRVAITMPLILDGKYTISLDGTDCITDAVGNALNNGKRDEIVSFFLDTTAPKVTVDSLATNDPTPELTGTVDDTLAQVLLKVDGRDYTAINNGNGTWTLAQGQIAPGLAEGIYDIAVKAVDQAGNWGKDSTTDELKVDLTHPKLISWDLIQDTGIDATDRLTNDTTPELIFTFSEPVYGNAGHIDLRDPTGAAISPYSISGWGTDTLRVAITTSLVLDGDYAVTLDGTDCIIDAVGNKLNGGKRDEVVNFTLDTTAPKVTVNRLATNDPTPALTGTVDDTQAQLVLRVDGRDCTAINNGNGTWTLAQGQIAPGLAEGIYDVVIKAVDQAGNWGKDSTKDELTVDLTYPKLISWDLIQDTGTDPTDGLTNDTTPELIFTFSEPVYGGAGHIGLRDPAGAVIIPDSISGWGTDTLTVTITTPLILDGKYTITLDGTDCITDAVGNKLNKGKRDEVVCFTLDTELAVTLTLDPATDSDPVGDDQTTFELVNLLGTTEPGLPVALYHSSDLNTPIAASTADGTGAFVFANIALIVGDNPFTVKTADRAGNQGSANRTIGCLANDAQAPVIAAQLVNDTGRSDLSESYTDSLTSDPTIAGTITDNNAITSVLLAIADSAPLTDITGNPALQADSSFVFDRAFFETLLGGPMTDSDYTLRMQAQDEFGNSSAVFTLSFTLDTTAPVVATPDLDAASDSGVSDTDNLTNDTTPTIHVDTEADALVSLSVDGIAVGQTTTGPLYSFTPGPLNHGDHTVSATAQDRAGNTGASAVLDLTIDTQAPAVTLTLDPATDSEPVGDNQTTFELVNLLGTTEPGLPVALYHSSDLTTSIAASTADGTGDFGFANITLILGDNPFTVITTDQAGNQSSANRTIARVAADLQAPVIAAQLVNDTGRADLADSYTDSITSDPTIAGTITDNNAITRVLLAIDDSAPLTDITGNPALQVDGSFAFDLSFFETLLGGPMTDGDYTLRMQAQDEFGNSSAVFTLSFTLDTTAPVVAMPDLDAASDSGVSDTDNLTNNTTPTIHADTEADALVSSSIDGIAVGQTTTGPLYRFTPGPLNHGDHTASATAQDRAGNIGASDPLDLTIDTQAPAVTLTLDPATDSEPVGDNQTTFELVNLLGTTEPGLPVALYHTSDLNTPIAASTADGTGAFSFAGIALILGDNPFIAIATDQTGNQGQADRTVVRAQQGSQIVLIEGSNFEVTHEHPFTVPGEAAHLSFTYDLDFDTSDNFINDAFEVALLDANGNTLVHVITNHRDAAFNITEGQTAQLGANTQQNAQTVQIDLTHIPAGTEATLVFRLVNNDTDMTSTVTLTDITVEPGSQGTPLGFSHATMALTTASVIDFNHLKDVTGAVLPVYGTTSYHNSNTRLYADLGLQNVSGFVVDGPLIAVIDHLSDPNVQVLNADGFTAAGLPYVDMSSLLSGGSLDPGASTTGSRTLEFLNPDGEQFSYDLILLGYLNDAPVFISEPNTEALPGKPYVYAAQATDANNDDLTYSLVMAPDNMAIDATSGQVTWTPAAGSTDLGTYDILIQIDDGRGGSAQQHYTLNVIAPPPNRPPVFTSIPVTEIALGGDDYQYDADATDPDYDVLSYSLAQNPANMIIDSGTGAILWAPGINDIGPHSVSISVSDGVGGVATQAYTLTVLGDPENHAPIILSYPVEDAVAGEDYVYDVQAVDPDADPVTYSLTQNPDGMTIDPQTGLIQWSPSPDILTTDQVSFSDSDFNTEDWDEQTVEIGGGGTSTVTRHDSGGNRWISVNVRTNIPVDEADVPQVYQFFWDREAIYDPGVSGTISSIDYSEMNRGSSVYGALTTPIAVRQDGHIYLVAATLAANGPWTEWIQTDLFESDFALLGPTNPDNAGIPLRPDFSSSGSPIQIGFVVWVEGSMSEYGPAWTNKDMDNWRVTVTPAADTSVEVIVQDDRGGQDIQSFTVGMTHFGALQGHVFNDLDLDGTWDRGSDLISYNWGYRRTMRYHGRTGSVIDVLQESWGGNAFVGEDGYLYLAEGRRTAGARICRYDAQTGELIEKLAFFDDTASNFSKIIQGPDGDFYGSSQPLDAIGKFDGSTGEYLGIFAQSSNMNNPVGMLFDSNGDLWTCNVASPYGYILKFDGQTGAYIGQLADLGHTFDMAWGPDGNAYVTDSGYVYRLDGDTGASLGRFTSRRAGYNWGGTIAFGPNGNIYVNGVNQDKNGVIDEYNGITGAYIQEFILEDALSSPAFMVFTPDIPAAEREDTLTDWIVYMDHNRNGRRDAGERWTTTDEKGRYVFEGVAAGTYYIAQESPAGRQHASAITAAQEVTVGHEGTVYNVDFAIDVSGSSSVQGTVFDDLDQDGFWDHGSDLISYNWGNGRTTRYHGRAGFVIDVLQESQGGNAFVGQDGYLYLVEGRRTSSARICRYDAQTGQLLEKLAIFDDTASSFSKVLQGPDGNFYGSSQPLDAIVKLDGTTGEYLGYFASTYSLNNPVGMLFDQNGDLWTANVDRPYGYVLRFDGETGAYEQVLAYLSYTFDMAWAPDGDAYITDGGYVSRLDGETGAYAGRLATLNQQSSSPTLAFGPDGHLYVTNVANQKGAIQEYGGVTGEYIRDFIVEDSQSIPAFIVFTPDIPEAEREDPIARRIVYLDHNHNGYRDGTEPWTTTDAYGHYVFEGMSPGTYWVALEGQEGWVPTTPGTSNHQITVGNDEALYSIDFGNTAGTYTAQNFPPEILTEPGTTAMAKQLYLYDAHAFDVNGDDLSFDLVVRPDGMVIDTHVNIVAWIPRADQVGTHNVILRVGDGKGGVDLQSWQITVESPNIPPVIVSTPSPQATVNLPYQYQVQAQDPEEQTITYGLSKAPTGMSIDPTTGLVTWTAQGAQIGSHEVIVSGTDERGAETLQAYDLAVVAIAPNNAPVFTSTPVVEMQYGGDDYYYDANATDPDQDVLTYSLIENPTGMIIDPNTGEILWASGVDDIGAYTVSLSVSDNLGGLAMQAFVLTVLGDPSNHAPIIISEPVGSATVGQGYVYDVEAIDPDADALTYSLLTGPDGMAIDDQTGLVQWTPSPDILAGEQVVFSDNDFNAEDWDEQTVEIGGGGTATVTRQTTGDNHWIYVSVRSNIPVNERDTPMVFQFFWNKDANYDPRLKGAISSVDYAELNRGYSTGGAIGAPITLRQNGHIYIVDANQAENSTWTEWTQTDVSERDFALLSPRSPDNVGVPLRPDFSSSGAPIQFGFVVSMSGSMSEYRYAWTNKDIDNWQVTITPKAMRHVEVRVRDDRGGYDTQTYDIDISRFGSLQGYVFNDQDQDGLWDHGSDLLSQNWGHHRTTRYHGRTGSIIDRLEDESQGSIPFVGEDGYLYLLENRRTSFARINRYDAQTGELIEKLAVFDDTGPACAKIIQGPDGNFYGSSQRMDAIVKFDGATGEYLGIFAQSSNMNNPVGMLFDRNGDLWTCNVASPYGYILKFDGQTGAYIGRLANLGHTFDMAWGPDGNAYVTDNGWVYRLDGDTGASLGRFTQTRAGFAWGGTIAIGPTGNIYLTGVNQDANGVIDEFDGVTGEFIQEFILEDALSEPAYLVFTPDIPAAEREDALSDWIVYLDRNRNGRRDAGERWTTTDADGRYVFEGMSAGTYWVAQESPAGWLQTAPETGFHEVNVGEDQKVYKIDFGLIPGDGTIENVSPEIYTDPQTQATADQVYVYDANAFDANGDDLTFDLVDAPDGMIIDAHMGAAAWIPGAGQLGIHDVVLRVQDGNGGQDLQSWQITVEAPNTPPVIVSRPSLQAVVDLPYQYQIQARDPESHAITYAVAKGPDGLTVDADTGLVTWTAPMDQLGTHEIILSATDAHGAETLQAYNLSVLATALNAAPVITSTPRTKVRLGTSYAYLIQAWDANGDPLTYSLLSGPTGMTVNAQDRVVLWTPTNDQFGAHPVQLQADDGRGASVQQSFTVQVTNANSNAAPIITSQARAAAVVSQMYVYDITADDADGDPLTWSLVDAPAGVSLNTQAGTLRWTPTLDQLGENTVTVEVTDPLGATAQQSFTITVRSSNLAPQIYSAANTQAFVDQAYTYALRAHDIEGDALTFSLAQAPTGMTVNPETGLIAWTPVNTQVGPNDVSVQVTDAYGGSATQDYTLVVTPEAVNQAPVITSTPQLFAKETTPYQYNVTAIDPEGGVVEYYLLEAPTGMTIDRDSGQIDWTPSADQFGTHTARIAALDTEGAGGQQQYMLTVRANQAPTIVSNPIPSVTEGLTYRYQVLVEDPDDSLFTYQLSTAPSGMTINSLGQVQWETTLLDRGNHDVGVQVTDTFGAMAQQSFTLTVAQDTFAPNVTLYASGNLVNPGESLSFQVRVTDNVGLGPVVLLIDGQEHALTPNGNYYEAEITFNTPGLLDVLARATDLSGNEGLSNTRQVRVFDPSDNTHPEVTIHSPDYQAMITYLTDIVISVQDANLAYWKVEYAPANKVDIKQLGADDPDYVLLAEGTDPVDNAVVAVFDPTILANDAYVMRVSAYDLNGAGWVEPLPFGVSGNAKLGNFTFTVTDMSVPLVGIPITINRTYDTLQANNQGDFGYGWSLGFADANIGETTPAGQEMQTGDRVYLTTPDGRRVGFTYEPWFIHRGSMLGYLGSTYNPRFTPDPGVHEKLTVKEGPYFRGGLFGRIVDALDGNWNPSQYVLTLQDGTKYDYIQGSGLKKITDRNDNVVIFTQSAITHSTGAQIGLIRDPQGRIVEIVDTTGVSVRYTYDAAGDLTGFTNQIDETTTYEYLSDPAHFLDAVYNVGGTRVFKAEFDDDGRLTSATDALGNVSQQDFDTAAMMGTQTDTLGNVTELYYDERGNVTREIDPLGGETHYSYDDPNNPDEETAITDPNGNATYYTYDAQGNWLTETDALGNTTTYTYDSDGNLLTETDASGNTTTHAYDRNGNLTRITDTLGQTRTWDYDDQGQLITDTNPLDQVKIYEYDAYGNLAGYTDSLGNMRSFGNDANGNRLTNTRSVTTWVGTETLVVQYVYNAKNQLIQIVDARGNISRTEYNTQGKRSATIDPFGNRTEFHYDSRGNLISTGYPDGTHESATYDAKDQRSSSTDRTGRTTQYQYDALGNLIRTVFPDGSSTETEYDSGGRVISRTDQRGNTFSYEYDAGDRQTAFICPSGCRTEYTHDNNGNKISETDALGNTTQFQYNALSQLVKTIYPDQTFATVSYNALGQKIAETDQAGITTRFEYRDTLEITTTSPNQDLTVVIDALGGRTEYAYNEVGNRITQTDANGNTTSFDFDVLGLPIARRLPSGQIETMDYDTLGRLVSRTDFNGNTITYEYDINNHLVQKSYPDGAWIRFTYTLSGKMATETKSSGEITSYTYDVMDRLLQRTDPDGSTIEYTYDASGNRTSVTTSAGTTTYTHNAAGFISTVMDPDGGVTIYTYNAVGNHTKIEYPNGTFMEYTYDSLNRPIEIVHRNSDGNVLASYTYTLGPAGNKTRVVENTGRTVDYTYDALYRLTQEHIDDPVHGMTTIDYTYDAVGNRLIKIETKPTQTIITTYTYDDNDRLLTEIVTVTGTDPSVATYTYTYDENGNTFSKTDGTNVNTYSYDYENRLIAADIQFGDTPGQVAYSYNSQGIRVSKTASGLTTRYLVDSNRPFAQVLVETTDTSSVNYTYGYDLISMKHSDGSSYYHYDGQMSTRLLTNAVQDVTDTYTFDAFGLLLEGSGSTVNNYLYTGEQFDPNTGFYYLRARFLNQDSGRFIWMDELLGDVFNPMSLNKYVYVHANPITNLDPSGNIPVIGYAILLSFVFLLKGHDPGGPCGVKVGDDDFEDYRPLSIFDAIAFEMNFPIFMGNKAAVLRDAPTGSYNCHAWSVRRYDRILPYVNGIQTDLDGNGGGYDDVYVYFDLSGSLYQFHHTATRYLSGKSECVTSKMGMYSPVVIRHELKDLQGGAYGSQYMGTTVYPNWDSLPSYY